MSLTRTCFFLYIKQGAKSVLSVELFLLSIFSNITLFLSKMLTKKCRTFTFGNFIATGSAGSKRVNSIQNHRLDPLDPRESTQYRTIDWIRWIQESQLNTEPSTGSAGSKRVNSIQNHKIRFQKYWKTSKSGCKKL